MGGAGGNQPDPGEIERRLRELDKEIGKPRAHEPSALERLAAAKKAEKKAQRKRDTKVLTALAVVFVLLAGGGIYTWLRVAPPSWLRHAAARGTPSSRPTAAQVRYHRGQDARHDERQHRVRIRHRGPADPA